MLRNKKLEELVVEPITHGGAIGLGTQSCDFDAPNLFLFLSDGGAGNVASLNLLQALRDFDVTNTILFLPAVSVPDHFSTAQVLDE